MSRFIKVTAHLQVLTKHAFNSSLAKYLQQLYKSLKVYWEKLKFLQVE